MRSGVGVVSILVGGSLACSNSGSSSAPITDGGADAFVCTDTAGSTVMASIDDVFNASFSSGVGPGLLCPLDANSTPVAYDTAIYTNCSTLQLASGDVQYGQCLGYLVWEVDLDSSGSNFSKCFYDVASHALVGVMYGDGTQDQCGNASYTIQAGSVQTCTISGLSSPGAGGMFEDCTPKPEGGADVGPG